MCTIDEIKSMLEGLGDDLRQPIVRSLGSSTVALFALPDNATQWLELAGSGTLVQNGDSYYILTAAHVWEEGLKSKKQVGITLTDNLDHQTPIDIDTIVPTILKPDASQWNEWGPDLAMLRIPLDRVGGIKAFQVFEDPNAPPKRLNAECIECWVAMGAPRELGTFTQNHAQVQISGRFVALPKYHHHAEYDYYDFEMDTTPPMPQSFQGFSGGGLWRVMVYCSPETGKVEWAKRLKGVLYWQFPVENGHRIIRCHGLESITAIAVQGEESC